MRDQICFNITIEEKCARKKQNYKLWKLPDVDFYQPKNLAFFTNYFGDLVKKIDKIDKNTSGSNKSLLIWTTLV